MKLPGTLSLCAVLAACFVVSACDYEAPQFDALTDAEDDLDKPDSLDVYIDATGPEGFYAQVEQQAYYTSREDYERDVPALYAQAEQAGVPIRFVFGPNMRQVRASSQGGVQPQWSKVVEAWGYVVVFSSPSLKYVSGCVKQNAYTANLRIHRYARGVTANGTPLRDYHLSAYTDIRSKQFCAGLVETETGSPNWCSCGGAGLRESYVNIRDSIQKGLQQSGMTVSQAALLAAAMVPLVLIAFSPVGL